MRRERVSDREPWQVKVEAYTAYRAEYTCPVCGWSRVDFGCLISDDWHDSPKLCPMCGKKYPVPKLRKPQ